jgi:hypothetical protein
MLDTHSCRNKQKFDLSFHAREKKRERAEGKQERTDCGKAEKTKEGLIEDVKEMKEE